MFVHMGSQQSVHAALRLQGPLLRGRVALTRDLSLASGVAGAALAGLGLSLLAGHPAGTAGVGGPSETQLRSALALLGTVKPGPGAGALGSADSGRGLFAVCWLSILATSVRGFCAAPPSILLCGNHS